MSNMEKAIELLRAIGIDTEITEETDVTAIATTYKEKQAELHKNNPAIMDEEKAKAKKEGEIIATKRFKKTINRDLGLGLTESSLNDLSVEDFVLKVKETNKQEVSKDVDELQKKIIEITNEKTTEIDKLKAEKEEVEHTWTNKWKDQVRTRVLKSKFDQAEYIGDKESLFDYFKNSIQVDGIRVDVDEQGNVQGLFKGDMKLLKPDNSAIQDLDGLWKLKMEAFVKKSNGATGKEKEVEAGLAVDKLPPAMQQRLKEMQEKQEKMAAIA